MSKISGRPLRLVLIRHGESKRNKAKKGSVYFPDKKSKKDVEGIPDHEIPLTKLGHKQAEAVGVYLKKKFGVPDFIYDSEYLRTKQTKDGFLKAFTPEEQAQIEQRSTIYLRERDPGYTYDMTKKQVKKYFKFLFKYWKTFRGFFNRPPGGESLADVVMRIRAFLFELYSDRDGQTVYLFAHGGTIRCIRFVIEHWTPKKFVEVPGPDNCGVTIYEQQMVPTTRDHKKAQRKKLVLDVYNDTSWAKDAALITHSNH